MCSVSYSQAGEGLTSCLLSTFCGVIAVHRGRKFRVVRVPDAPCLSVDPLSDPDSDYDTQSFPACQGVLGKNTLMAAPRMAVMILFWKKVPLKPDGVSATTNNSVAR
mgnify:FL=1